MSDKTELSTIDDLIPDDKNANRGTEYGTSMLEKSIRELGLGRSVLVDKHNRLIAGNKTTEAAVSLGIEDVIVVETTGDKLVVVKRTDIDLSIPTYSNLCESILRMSTYFIKPDSTVYDLGCSTGKMLSRMAQAVPSTVRLIGIDVADNLLKEAGDPRVEIHRVDLTTNRFVMGPADLVLSIFTLQFLPVSARADVVKKAYDALQPGGAMIVAEKLFIDDGFIQDVYTFGYYDMKLKNFTADEVLGKQLSLRTIMRPQTEAQNLRMLSCFDRIYPFWQYLQFRAWLCIK